MNQWTIKKTPLEIWDEYEQGKSYKTTINLYEQVKANQNFYLGKQWEGVNAPDIEKPVVNICKQWVNYAISMLASDDIGVMVEMPNTLQEETKKALEYIANDAIKDVIEQTKFKSKTRAFLKNCAIDGDAFYHWWFNTGVNELKPLIGAIDVEILDNTNVIFGNPAEPTVDAQPYILVVSKLPTDMVKEWAKGKANEITDDSDDYNQHETDAKTVGQYTTVLTKVWREKGEIWFTQTTRNTVLKTPTNTNQRVYPFVKMSWNVQKNSYHGASPLTEILPNQIMVNKFYMMQNEFVKKLAFPKVMYDKTKISSWNNRIEAIGVNGDPREAVFVPSPVAEMSQQAVVANQDMVQKTKETLGIFEVALGNAQPQNTSAIIALQKTASQPLELQKLDYYQVVEDSIRIIMDLMATYYGKRKVKVETDMIIKNDFDFDFSDLRDPNIKLNVEVGTSAYWSEITQVQTIDNMFKAGIIDALTYLEQLPSGILPNKSEIIAAYKKRLAEAQNAQQGQVPGQEKPSPSEMPAQVGMPNYAGGSVSQIPQTNGPKFK